ncbi:MAG: S49 family peptidase [Lautropia sp.]|nr:S49 family peptidase [Lautropia sp.]
MSDKPENPAINTNEWGRSLIEELARESLKERRARRRWRIFFMLVFLGLIAFAMVQCSTHRQQGPGADGTSYVASISIRGVIGSEPERVNADKVIKSMRRAFADPHATAVILRINSPGGSPVQAGVIVDEMRRLRRNNPDKALYAVIEELGASAAYYVAAAADRVYVDKASLVGSIGVVLGNFGLQELARKLGIENRTMTAGKNKAFLDPFSPLTAEQKAHAQTMLDEIHRQFIAVVKEGRGQRLKETPEMFSGLVWTGERSVELGLADGLGSVDSVARDVADSEEVVDFTEYTPFEQWARQLGAVATDVFWNQLESESVTRSSSLR